MSESRKPIDVLRHEAGHMVVARLLGFETGELTFDASHAGAAVVLDVKLPDLESVVAFLEKRVVVLFAGVLAESLRGSKIGNEHALQLISGPEGSDDYSKARELIRLLAGITRGEREYQRELDQLRDKFWNRAATLVEKYAIHINAISKHWRERLGGRSKILISRAEIDDLPSFQEIKCGCER